jgi:hypothetical protein
VYEFKYVDDLESLLAQAKFKHMTSLEKYFEALHNVEIRWAILTYYENVEMAAKSMTITDILRDRNYEFEIDGNEREGILKMIKNHSDEALDFIRRSSYADYRWIITHLTTPQDFASYERFTGVPMVEHFLGSAGNSIGPVSYAMIRQTIRYVLNGPERNRLFLIPDNGHSDEDDEIDDETADETMSATWIAEQ